MAVSAMAFDDSEHVLRPRKRKWALVLLACAAFFVVGFWMLAAFLAEAIASLALGSAAVRGDNFAARAGALLLGLIVVALLLSIPYAGPWLGLLVFLFGFGGFCLWLAGFAPAAAPASASPPAAGVAKA